MSKDGLLVRIDAGSVDRSNDMVSLSAKPNVWFDDWQEGTTSLCMSQVSEDGEKISDIPCQFNPVSRELSWLTGTLKAGKSALYKICMTDAQGKSPNRYSIENRTSHLLIKVDDALFTRYNYLGVWKPYFWPVNGTCGSVVRGAGGGDHPHHTGLYPAYGGHGEGGSANIWSDWDEPPYGPCGKMLHQRFVDMSEGQVYAEFVEDVIYVKGNGDVILDERRTARMWYASDSMRFLDLSIEATTPMDIGERIFMLVARITPSMNLPQEGHVENSDGDLGRQEVQGKNARWCDLSGKVGDGINGIGLFDHPQNPEHPGLWGRIAVSPQMTLVHHPPDEVDGDRLCINYRIYIHDGITPDADVEARYQSYISPVGVEIIE